MTDTPETNSADSASPVYRRVSHLRCEARRICDREGINDLDILWKIYLSSVHREYLREIQPFIDMKARVLSLVIPQITIRPGELAEFKYDLNDEQKEAMAQIEEFIASIGKQYEAIANAALGDK